MFFFQFFQMMQLEQFGVESASIILDENSDVCFSGSKRGIEFLKSEPGIDLDFKQFFSNKPCFSYQ